jgi:pyridoxamine 5'-phosphate oxidase-like protein
MSHGSDTAGLDDALAFLGAHPHVFLLTRRADGFPTAYAMTARVDGSSVLFSTYGASAKVVNLLHGGTARVLAFDEDGGNAMIEVGGPVRLVESTRWLDPVQTPISAGTPAAVAPVPTEVVELVRSRHESGKRVVVEVQVTHARRGSRLG